MRKEQTKSEISFTKKSGSYERKLLTTTIAVIFIALIFFAGFTLGSDPISDSSYYPGTQTETASFLVFKESATYYAKNGVTGSIDFSGADPGAVIQSCIDTTVNLESIKIHLAKGVFTFLSGIVCSNQNFFLSGEGLGIFLLPRGGTVIEKGFNGDLITLNYANAWWASFQIEDIDFYGGYTVSGGGYTGNGIVINGAWSGWWRIAHIRMSRFEGNAIQCNNVGKHSMEHISIAECADSGIFYDGAYDWQWYDVEIDNSAPDYIGIAKPSANITNALGEILGGHFEGYYGIECSSNSRLTLIGTYIPIFNRHGFYSKGSSKVIGCTIGDEGTGGNKGDFADGSGVYAGGVSTSGTVVMGTRITGSLIKYAIFEADGVNYGKFVNNHIATPNAVEAIHVNGSNTQVFGNTGFETENSGTSTGTGSEQVIAHTLAGTPTLVLLSPPTTNAYESSTANATHIFITADNAEDYYWYVNYDPVP